jgi:hypothetical protein
MLSWLSGTGYLTQKTERLTFRSVQVKSGKQMRTGVMRNCKQKNVISTWHQLTAPYAIFLLTQPILNCFTFSV